MKEAKENYNIKYETEKKHDIIVIHNYKGSSPAPPWYDCHSLKWC